MKILVTGSRGMLATDVIPELEKTHYVKGVDLSELDISKNGAVTAFVRDMKPDIVVNLAAYADVDGCETNVETAHKANSIGPKNLAIACNDLNIPLVHISTEYIFDGTKNEPYIESDKANPLSVYGQSKLDGEVNVINHHNKFFIIRIQSLYGKNGKNFIKTMLNLAKNNKPIKVVSDQITSLTYTKDVGTKISELINTDAYGIYHVTNSGIVSWYDFALEIFRQAGVKADVEPCMLEDYVRPAKRPKYAPLRNLNLKLNGFDVLRPYEEALRDYLIEEGYSLND